MNSDYTVSLQKLQNKNTMKRWKKQKTIFFALFVFILFILSTFYDSPNDLDRYENYSIGRSLINMSFSDIFSFYSNNGYDFIFYLGLGFFAKFESGMPLFMGIITALYYIEIFKCFLNTQGKLTPNRLLLLTGLLCIPNILYVVNLSRTVFALAFFAIGVNNWFNKKYILNVVFFALTFFTHAGEILFIMLFYIGVIVHILLKNKPFVTRLLCIFLPPAFFVLFRFLFLDVLQNELLIGMFFDTKYEHYLEATGTSSLEGSIGKLASVYGCIFFSYVLLNIDKEVTLRKVLFLVFTTITVSLLTVNQNLLNRLVLVLPFFYTTYFLELLEKYRTNVISHKSKLDWFTISSFMFIMIFALIILQERKSFLPFFFS